MDVDDLLKVLAALPASGNMSDIRKACPREMTPHELWTALHASGWVLGGRNAWRKSRDALAWRGAPK